MTVVLIDASSYIYRAFHASAPLQRSDGLPTNAVHGFCNMMWRLKKRHVQASHFAVIFDKGKSSKRVALDPNYKATRAETPSDLKPQFELIREATRSFGFPIVEQWGVEADDLIASYAEAAAGNGDEVTIVSVDKDLMQLLRPGVGMFDIIKGRSVETDDVIAKLGVPPHLAIDAQALIGDTSDNVPGIPGIGPKTAGKLLAEFGSLDNVLANWQKIKNAKTRDAIMMHKESALRSRELVTLMRDVPLPVPLRELESKDVNVSGLLEFARKMEFASFGADVETFYGANA